jgi:hypothetical protein
MLSDKYYLQKPIDYRAWMHAKHANDATATTAAAAVSPVAIRARAAPARLTVAS